MTPYSWQNSARRLLCGFACGLWGCTPHFAPPPQAKPSVGFPVLSQGGAQLLGKVKRPSPQKKSAKGLEVKPPLMID